MDNQSIRPDLLYIKDRDKVKNMFCCFQIRKVLFFAWHEIGVSIRIAFHAIKNITLNILS